MNAAAIPEGFRPLNLPRNPFIEANGPLHGRMDGEQFVLGFLCETKHCNPMMVCHGGMMATLADMLLLLATNIQTGLGQFRLTVSLDVDFLAPVKFYRDEPRTLTLAAVISPDGNDLVAHCTLSASRMLKGDQAPRVTKHFTGRVRLAAGAPRTQRAARPALAHPPAATHGDIYRVFFHGPAYQVIDEAWHSGRTAVARLAQHLPAGHTPETDHTTTEPRLAEACFQTAGLWEIGQAGHVALPAHADLVSVVHRPKPDAELFAVAHPTADGCFDCQIVDRDGDVVLRVDGYRTIGVDSPLPADLQQPIHAAMSG